MAEISQGYKKKVIPDSDSTHLEEEFVDGEEILRTWVCKVCKKPFGETEEKVVCEKCRHYCHTDHSSKYHSKVYDHVCLVDEIGVNKQSYIVLHAIAHGCGKRQIKNATKLQSNEVDFTITDLKKAGLVREKFFSIEITYKAHEVLPILEKIYGNEEDVQKLTGELAGSSGLGVMMPGFPIGSNKVMFAILAIGAGVIMFIIQGAVLSVLYAMHAPSALNAIVWILIMLGTVYVVYRMKGWFDL